MLRGRTVTGMDLDETPNVAAQPVHEGEALADLGNLEIENRYRLLRPLGKGGFGHVWYAEDLKISNRFVAIKIFPPFEGVMAEDLRFEASCLAVLDGNPHIVSVFDYGFLENGAPYIVMQYIEGRSLRQELDQRICMPWIEVAALGVSICDGLAAAHVERNGRRILHRDIKPGNIMLSRRSPSDGEGFRDIQCVLVDFGMAKMMTKFMESTNSKPQAGTLSYMSPEQYSRGGKLGPATDIYSLGLVLSEAATGIRPLGFCGVDLAEKVRSGKLPGVPENLKSILASMCQEKSGDRPGVQDVRAGLERVVSEGYRSMPVARNVNSLIVAFFLGLGLGLGGAAIALGGSMVETVSEQDKGATKEDAEAEKAKKKDEGVTKEDAKAEEAEREDTKVEEATQEDAKVEEARKADTKVEEAKKADVSTDSVKKKARPQEASRVKTHILDAMRGCAPRFRGNSGPYAVVKYKIMVTYDNFVGKVEEKSISLSNGDGQKLLREQEQCISYALSEKLKGFEFMYFREMTGSVDINADKVVVVKSKWVPR